MSDSESEKEPDSVPLSELEFPGYRRVAAANFLARGLNPHPSPLPSPYSEEGSQMSDFGDFGPVPRATDMRDAKALDDEEARGQKRGVDDGVDGGDDGGVAKAVDDKQSFTYVGKYPLSEDGSVVFDDAVEDDGATSSAASSSGAATSSGSFGSGLSNITLSSFNSEAISRGQIPPHFKDTEEEEINININDLLRGGGGLRGDGGRFAGAYDSAMSGVNDEFLEITRIIMTCGKGVFNSVVVAGKNLYRILAFATASKLNLIIVLGICGALYNNCPYAAYVFDFLISRTLPIIKFLGHVTGFSAGIVNLFKWLGSALGIDKLIELLEAIKTAIPSAEEIKAIIEEAAKETAKGVAGLTAANTARDFIINRMMTTLQETAANTETLNTAMDLLNAAAPQAAPSVLQTMLTAAASGVGSGVGQTAGYLGVRSLIGVVVGTNPAFAALQNGGGKKRRRRTMRHKKRSQTKRRVKHGKRRQTKKRQNKRTKTKSKQ